MVRVILLVLWIAISQILYSQEHVELNWFDNAVQFTDEDSLYYLNFDNALNAWDYGLLPQFYTTKELVGTGFSSDDFTVTLGNKKWESLPGFVPDAFQGKQFITEEPIVEHHVGISRKKYSLDISVIPLRNKNGVIERLVSFTINVSHTPSLKLKSDKSIFSFKTNSVLSTGKWVKISVQETGIHKLSYSDISGMGLNPETVKIYGSGNGVLSEFISNYTSDDLDEIPLWIEKGSDNVFNAGDFLLFYACGPHRWDWSNSTKEFVHTQHPFSDKAYYYLTSDNGAPLEILQKTETTLAIIDTAKMFTDFAFYEPMEDNLLESGSEWYDEKMDVGSEFVKTFSFPTISTGDDAKITVVYAARSTRANSTATVKVQGENLGSISISNASTSNIGVFAYERRLAKTFSPTNNNLDVSISFNNTSDASATGWLNYIRLNLKRPLEMVGDQLHFRYPETFGQGSAVRYELTGSNQTVRVLDVTNKYQVKLLPANMQGNTLVFKDDATVLREYVAFKPSGSFPKPKTIGEVKNQNLHALDPADLVILSNKDLMGKGMAQDLYELHMDEGLSVLMVTPEEIYNEFSGGKPDVTAIRWFMKMLYDRATNEADLPKYLLIFGDGTYDNRPGVYHERNRVLTFQSKESLHQANTYVSDDYFAILDDNEGSLGNADKVDIGVGRYPVHTEEEARSMVDKTKFYVQNRNRTMWKNTVCFVADDGDNNIHMRDANLMADKVMRNHPDMIVDKILLDAYQQVIEASGPSYPDANKALQNSLQKGVLLLNYSGHGGVTGLTDEKIVTKNVISNYSNLNNLPVWVTATCEFSRFDLHNSTTAGEMVLLSRTGGGISLFTTTRVVFSSSNYTINNNFFDYAFKQNENGESLRLGDICRETKVKTGTGANKRKFMLLGNPALSMLMPELKVRTSHINGSKNFTAVQDTFSALQPLTVGGYIEDFSGDTASYFNGEVFIKVYDKKSSVTTLMNDAGDYSSPLTFDLWNKTIFNGNAKVENGVFEFQFMVPKEINYEVGSGRIVYYATSDNVEAKGYSENLKIGGFNNNFVEDNEGPEINLYLNSKGFTDGATVSPNPLFIADIVDQSGINTSGVGIGHDIIVMLDNNPLQTYVLNDFYFPVDGFSKGQVRFKLEDLPQGEHTLFFRVWDIYNNSSSKTINFVVDASDGPDIANVFCYPNPATDHVNFEFEHNRPESVMDVTIDIFSPTGQLISKISERIYSVGNRIAPINWDLTDISGRKVNKGIYFYRVRINANGKLSDSKAQKLILN